jgi:hypothetical protein
LLPLEDRIPPWKLRRFFLTHAKIPPTHRQNNEPRVDVLDDN